MRSLALVLALAISAPAAAADNCPRMRCASCSLLPSGATGSDLTLSGNLTLTGNAGVIATFYSLNSTVNQPTNGMYWSAANTVAFSAGGSQYLTIGGGGGVNPMLNTSYAIYMNGGALSGIQWGAGSPAKLTSETADSSSAIAGYINTSTAWSTSGAHLWEWRTGGVAKSFVDVLGVFNNTVTTGTAASGTGVTANYTSNVRHFVHKVTVTNAAMTAAATTDITLHLTPVNTRIIRVLDEVGTVFSGGALSAVTVTCGKTAGGNEYLLSHSVLAATGTFGDVVAEMGAGVVSATLADMGTVASGVPGAITVQCRFTCTGANCNAATQGSAIFYVEGVTY